MTERKEKSVDDLVGLFVRDARLYADCINRLRELLERLLETAGLTDRLHTVTCRPKEPEKLREKLLKGEGRYSSLDEITDLVGIRVVTYFADDVDAIAKVIEKEFDIDLENSTDKREALEHDRFGYLSLHYVCTLSAARAAFGEYKPFKDMKCEIQVRSILQHAWAEIEHDLGYKTAAGIPLEMRRRFSRLAGVLEGADDEFRRLREELEVYAEEVGERIAMSPEEVLIDKVSLLSFVGEDELVLSVDAEMAKVSSRAPEAEPKDSYLEPMVPLLLASGFESISDLRQTLEAHRKEVVEHFACSMKKIGPVASTVLISRGVSLFRLAVLVLAKRKDPELFRAAWAKADWSIDDEFAQREIECLDG